MSIDCPRVQELIQKHQIRLIDLKMVDLVGRLRHVTLPVENFNDETCASGIGFDGSSYGFKKVTSSDMVAVPVLNTAWVDAFRDAPTLSMFASAHVADVGLPLSDQDTRGILHRAVSRMRHMGVADDILFAPEYEFYIFSEVEARSTTTEGSFALASGEAEDGNAYHLENPADLYAGFRDRAVRMFLELGMPVRYHHHEVGGHGQQEVEFNLEPAVAAADHALMVKYILANLAHRDHLFVTFMPKPVYEQAGSGWHTHMQMIRDGENLFHDPAGFAGLSQTALHAIGGLLTHGRALAALTNASTNSYKRLTSGFEAPNSLTFGPADRTAAVRIPKWAQGKATRIEYRSSDLTGNPYLILGGLVMAILDGLERRIDPVAEGFGPSERLDPARVRKLPMSLSEALDALEADHEFLVRGGVFSESVLERWVATKRGEAHEVSRRPHPHEFKLYF